MGNVVSSAAGSGEDPQKLTQLLAFDAWQIVQCVLLFI